MKQQPLLTLTLVCIAGFFVAFALSFIHARFAWVSPVTRPISVSIEDLLLQSLK